ncbi:MAG: FMN-binding glutamate synthase family protein [Peptococcaceae bacterium]|nr:FMN-binding glutamate synthase family protein [Peptococcaceae bacterium]
MKNMINKDLRDLVLFAGAGTLGVLGSIFLARLAFNKVFDWATGIIMTDVYDENLMEFYSAGTRMGAQNILETNLRSEKGQAITRPLGSPRKFLGFNDLMFNMAQLHRLVTPPSTKIDITVTIGPQAKRPLRIGIPIIIAPMAYGEALSAAAKIALAKGASTGKAAINSGEGPFLPEERQHAKFYIQQYNRGTWAKEDEVLKKADAIEIQIGQGAIGGVGHSIKAEEIDRNLRSKMQLQRGQDAIVHARQQHTATPVEFAKFIDYLRKVTGGVPIGAKIAAGMDIELDLDFLIESGVDFVTIDGAQAATKGSTPILQDDFGIPTIYALCRATRHLQKHKARGKITLLVGGGLFTPGDFLKAIALGADAVCIGTAALFAVTHTQTLTALPFEPPTQVVWYNGKYSHKFSAEEGGKALGQYLKSCAEEMVHGIQGLGKTSLKELDHEDLCGLTSHICEVARVKPGWLPS